MSTRHIPSQIGDLPPIGRPAAGALLAIGVTTLEQVAELGEHDLLGLHGVGPKAVRILREAMKAEGLSLAE